MSRNSGPHQPMGRGLTPALRRSRGIGAEIAISRHDHSHSHPAIHIHTSSAEPPWFGDRARLGPRLQFRIPMQPSTPPPCLKPTGSFTAECMHTTDVTVVATTESRNKAALQVCVLWRCRCAFSGAACARMRRHRPRVCLSAFGPARSPAMTGSGALHCDVRVAAQVRRVSPSGLPACLHPRMRRSEAARAWFVRSLY